jgi:predicted nicotinamide N-methyase
MKKRRKKEIRAHGIRLLLSRHPEVRKLKRRYIPEAHGDRLWTSSWLIMEYFRRRGLAEGTRVMEVGCGWGLAGIYCAKKHGALVTGVDIDPEVLPFMRLHGEINGVTMEFMQRSFNGLYRKHLERVDVLIGADICFWDKMVVPLKRLIIRARKAGARLVLIADPGRSPFEEIGEYFAAQGVGKIMDWTTQRPRRIQGRLLEISS